MRNDTNIMHKNKIWIYLHVKEKLNEIHLNSGHFAEYFERFV